MDNKTEETIKVKPRQSSYSSFHLNSLSPALAHPRATCSVIFL